MKPPASTADARTIVHAAAETWSPRAIVYLATIAGFGEPDRAARLNLSNEGERDTDPGGIPCTRASMPGLAYALAGMVHVYRTLDVATRGMGFAAAPSTPRDVTRALDAVTLAGIAAEVKRGRAKFPGGRFLLPALVEEVGELCCAILDGTDAGAIRSEAMQVAAVASRIAEEGDKTSYRADGFAEMVYALGGVARHAMQRKPAALRITLMALYNATGRMLAGGDRTFDAVTDEEAQP